MQFDVPLAGYANDIDHPHVMKETITKYDKLAKDPVTKEVWTKAFLQRTWSSCPRLERD
jgi:hypothetical protein